MKHSEGPWRITRDTRIEYGPMIAGDGFCVAKIMRDAVEWKANAVVIEAAPDMLEFIRKVASEPTELGSEACDIIFNLEREVDAEK